MIMPLYLSARILNLHDGTNNFLVAELFYLPTFIMSKKFPDNTIISQFLSLQMKESNFQHYRAVLLIYTL